MNMKRIALMIGLTACTTTAWAAEGKLRKADARVAVAKWMVAAGKAESLGQVGEQWKIRLTRYHAPKAKASTSRGVFRQLERTMANLTGPRAGIDAYYYFNGQAPLPASGNVSARFATQQGYVTADGTVYPTLSGILSYIQPTVAPRRSK